MLRADHQKLRRERRQRGQAQQKRNMMADLPGVALQ